MRSTDYAKLSEVFQYDKQPSIPPPVSRSAFHLRSSNLFLVDLKSVSVGHFKL